MYGTLYICATPIGNLGDITERVISCLKNADLIAAEDTRNSMKLLSRFDIHTPLTSYHEFNKTEKAEELLYALREGRNIALISDAGTPVISDPGDVLIRRCIEEGIPYTSLPGPSAVITALTLSGLPARRFCFEGFLPRQKSSRRQILSELRDEVRTIVLYEAPHRLKETLSDLYEYLGDRPIAICRELTKVHEEVVRLTLSEAIAYYEETGPRGEYVLVLSGKSPEQKEEERKSSFLQWTVPEHVDHYMKQGMPQKEAMRRAAKDRGVSRRDIYREIMEKDNDGQED
ncbi:MAG: 16S rRNA (cytidine(1402)-2'-O)-methyltransferase [Lachnospiraceae bacterium]|nr:16S rRNA (cytidine(1402)-2'-O)-methyltransferase [Lachnospiraceae bacterium]